MVVVAGTYIFWSYFRPATRVMVNSALLCNQMPLSVTLPARDERHGELSASLHPREGGLTAAPLPDASARKKLKTNYKNTSGPPRRARMELSASSHPREGGPPAAALPCAFARKKLKTKFSNTSDQR